MAETGSTYRPILGLDFGTSTTCAAALKAGRLEIIKDVYGQDDTTPSCVLFTPNSYKGKNRDSILVGEIAEHLEHHHSKSTVVEMKRFLGKFSDDPALTCDRHFYPHEIVHSRNKEVMLKLTSGGIFSPVEASSVFLKEIKSSAERQLACEVDQAVVTVPSSYGFWQSLALKEACIAAGLRVVRLVNEATAVSLAHAYRQLSWSSQTEQFVLVVSVGAAFVSVSLMHVEHGRSYEEKAVSGISDLGGNNFDVRIMNHMIAQIKTLTGRDISLNNKQMMARLRKGVKTLKKSLTEHEEATVNICLESGGIDLSLTRAEFEKLNGNLFVALLEPVGRVLDDSKLRKEQIDEVVLAGGSCRIPCIQRLFRNYFDRESLSFSFSECTTQAAIGAAILGANLQGYESQSISKLIQVIPNSIGVEIKGRNFGTVIKRNSKVPQSITKTYSTYNDYQSQALIAVYEGERIYAKDNFFLGQVIVKNIHEQPRGFPEIDVTIEFDQDRNITVKVVDVNSDQLGTSFTVTMESILFRNSKVHQDESKSMAIVDRDPTDGRTPGSDHGWEPVDFKPATQLKATDDSTTENEQSQLTFRILTKRHSRGNLLSSLSRHMNQHLHPALTTHSRTSSEPNIAKDSDKDAFQEIDDHQVHLQHAMSVANSALRRVEIEKKRVIERAEEAEMRAVKFEKQKNIALEQVEELEATLEAQKERNNTLQTDLEEASEQAALYFEQYGKVCAVLKKKEAATIDPRLLWVIQRDEIEISDEELGRGGWGTVHKAMFRGTTVAAKRMYRHIVSDYNCELFEREMNIASRIRHPNLVQFIGATAQEKQELIILTEIMSTSLWDELQKRPLSQLETISISLDVAKALNYLHLMRPDPIIHRDVSSANVLLNPGKDGEWITKLSDYGSANYACSAVTQGAGNAAYAAPETLQTPKMDVYSFGVLLLEMSVRRIPDSRATLREKETLICNISFVHLQNLVRLCTTKDASGRPTLSEIIQTLSIANQDCCSSE